MTATKIRVLSLGLLCSMLVGTLAKADDTFVALTDRIFIHEDMQLAITPGTPAKVVIYNAVINDNVVIVFGPTTVEFACDLDGVVLYSNTTSKIKAALPYTGTAIKFGAHLVGDSVRWLFTGKEGDALKLAKALDRQDGAASKKALEEYQEGLGDIVDKAIDEKYVIRGMLKILYAINGNRYVIRAATNQPIEEYNRLAQRLPEVFNLFAKGGNSFFNENHELISKPNSKYFETYIRDYNIKSTVHNKGGKRIAVFIDNKIENVHTAARDGMIAIHFIGVKQLIEDFHKLGLPTPSRLNDF